MTDALKAKAAEWFVRLRAPDVSDDERQAADEWLAQTPERRRAMDQVEAQWRDLDGLKPWAEAELAHLAQTQAPKPRLRLGYWLLGVATAAIAAVAIIIVTPMMIPAPEHHVATTKGEQRRIVLDDGSRVHLNSLSTVDIRFTHREREVRLLEGEGLFDVAHDPDRPFVVQVPGSKVVAVGTRFNVHFMDDELSVTVLEGKVMVVPDQPPATQKSEPELLLEPNQQARIDVSGAIEAIKTVDATRLTAWDKGLLIFDNTPLREVAREISRYVSGEIRIATDVPDYPVTGTVKIRDKETMLRILSEVTPVTPVRTSATVTTLMHTSRQARGAGN